MVGAGTALADDPRLTVRLPGCGRAASPCGCWSTPPAGSAADGHLFDGEAETLVATTPAAPAAAVDAWKAAGAEVLIVRGGADRRSISRIWPGCWGSGGCWS